VSVNISNLSKLKENESFLFKGEEKKERINASVVCAVISTSGYP
jgi:hypothetical protein